MKVMETVLKLVSEEKQGKEEEMVTREQTEGL